MWGSIIAGAGMLLGSISGSKGAKKQDSINDMNASLVQQEGKEEERRLQRDIVQSESLMGALSAASGVQMSGSREAAVTDVKRENKAQFDWLSKSTRNKAAAVRAGGQLQTSSLKTQAAMQGVRGFSSISQGLFGE